MIKALAVTLFPVVFMAVLVGGGERLRRRQIEQDGDAPIGKSVFYGSKYLIVVVWVAMILASWGVRVSFVESPAALQTAAVCLWVAGFLVLFAGRFGLGDSFRIGRPRESTRLRTDGLFRISRNPMYVGVYSTLLAATLYTMNPALLLAGIFIAAVHHRIILAEEAHLRSAFGKEYAEYCRRVRRYL